ncbi:4'-phosphopantetheinyl transferase family protein [Tahibacter amnicola]|uniref:4'-phosphopantetheinyl transferase superfamily protein n=1 Tax=Tahibacter amnicola TaxID=2976241 RepID=A0ABY6BEX6_9GAMM|nr:4'-phosphopantetheinyl transferase superfamily protein [Tahibacter amnicola]UXI68414.1 4'-phosphopantetheinyl transferase superfamily protein [Tahibacter amnicola]
MITASAFQPVDTVQPATGDIHLYMCEFAHSSAMQCRQAMRSRLYAVLSGWCGRTVSADDLHRSEHGKPTLRNGGPLHFSLSHSGSLGLIAVAWDTELGVDVEQPGKPRAVAALARRYFTATEADWLARCDESVRQDAFLTLWTAKEAVAKAIGRGLAYGLDRIGFVAQSGDGRWRLDAVQGEAGPAARWQCHPLQPGRACHGAVAWRGTPRPIQAFRFFR